MLKGMYDTTTTCLSCITCDIMTQKQAFSMNDDNSMVPSFVFHWLKYKQKVHLKSVEYDVTMVLTCVYCI